MTGRIILIAGFALALSNASFAMKPLADTKIELAELYDLANSNRQYFPTIWYYEIYIENSWATGLEKPLFEAIIDLHHLAGNALHIYNMIYNKSFRECTRNIEKSHNTHYDHNADIIAGRDSKNDFNNILNIFRRFAAPGNNAVQKAALYNDIRSLERELRPYWSQRKLDYKRVRRNNYDQEYFGQDFDQDFD